VKDSINNKYDMDTKYLGIDVGGTNIKVVIVDESGKVLDQSEVPTEDSSSNPEKWKHNIIDQIKNKTAQFTDNDPGHLKCGISAPGLVGNENKQIMHMPGRLSGLEKFNWSKELGRSVSVINDAHAACLAEYESFYKDKIQNMLMLTLGTGVGGGAILNGTLFQGAIQRAGHFGHITVNHVGIPTITNMVGSLEYAFGNFSVGERTHDLYKNTEDLVAAYEKGDPLATYWWLVSVQKLSSGLASLINAFSPELIVLGGGITCAGKSLFTPLKEFMSLYEWQPDGHQVKIVKANYGSYAGAVGAAFFANSKTKDSKK